jgi:hypothetical protein
MLNRSPIPRRLRASAGPRPPARGMHGGSSPAGSLVVGPFILGPIIVRSLLGGLLLAVSLLPALPAVAETIDYARHFHWCTYASTSGSAAAVTSDAGRAYLLLSNRLEIRDVTAKNAPPLIGQVSLPGQQRDIEVQSSIAAVASYNYGLILIDVLDPAHPQIVGALTSIPTASRVVLDGNRAYVLDNPGSGDRRIHVIDVANPAHPVELTSFVPGPLTREFDEEGGLLGVSGIDSFRILDVSNPFSPREIYFTWVPGDPGAVAIRGSAAYVGYSVFSLPPTPGGICRFDLTDPSFPKAAGCVEIAETYFPPSAISVADSVAFVAYPSATGVYAVQITLGEEMTVLEGISASTGTSGDICATDDGLLVALTDYSGADLHVYRGSDFGEPRLDFFANNAGGPPPAVLGNRVYYPAITSIHLLDVTDPRSIAHVEQMPLPSELLSFVVSPRSAFYGGYEEIRGGTVAPSGHITWCWEDQSKAPFWSMVQGGGRIFTSNDTELYILAGGNPCEPELLGSMTIPQAPRAMAAQGDYLYLAMEATLEVVDVSVPSAPRVVSTLTVSGVPYMESLTVSGSLALAGLWDGELWVVDISDPLHPASLSRLPLPSTTHGVVLDGSLAYCGCMAFGLAIVDLADPQHPYIMGGAEFRHDPGAYGAVCAYLTQNCLVLADRDRGLFTFPRQRLATTSVPESDVNASAVRLVITNPAVGAAIVRIRPGKSIDPASANPTAANPAWASPSAGAEIWRLDIYDPSGRHVRSLVAGPGRGGESVAHWDGRDDAGRMVESGVYLVRAAGNGASATGRVVWMR